MSVSSNSSRAVALLLAALLPPALSAQAEQDESKVAKASISKAAHKYTARGRVLGPLGEAVPGAELWYRIEGDRQKRGLARADARGRFTLRELPSDRDVRVSATGDGLCVVHERIRAGSTGTVTCQLRLWSAAEIRGTVVDEKGAKVARAVLTASYDIARAFGSEAQATASSAEDGSFVLARVPLGRIHVCAHAPGFVLAQTSLDLAEDQEVVVRMKRGTARKLALRVQTEDGEPVEGCAIQLRAIVDGTTRVLPGPMAGGTTDAGGSWSMDGYPEDFDLRISASREGHAIRPSTLRVRVKGGARPGRFGARSKMRTESAQGLRFVARVENKSWMQLHGRVVDAAGQPVPGLRLECRAGAARLGARAVTASDGSFKVACFAARGERVRIFLLESTYSLALFSARQRSRVPLPPKSFACRADAATALEIRVVRGAILRGRVMTEGGLAARAARVRLEHFMPSGRTKWFPVLSERTNARGEFVFYGLFPGMGRVRVQASGSGAAAASGEMKVEAGKVFDDIKLVVPDPATVTGRVVDAKGRPLRGARAQLVSCDPASGRPRGKIVQVLTNHEGRFVHLDIPSGHYGLKVCTADERSVKDWNAGPFEVKGGRTTELHDVTK